MKQTRVTIHDGLPRPVVVGVDQPHVAAYMAEDRVDAPTLQEARLQVLFPLVPGRLVVGSTSGSSGLFSAERGVVLTHPSHTFSLAACRTLRCGCTRHAAVHEPLAQGPGMFAESLRSVCGVVAPSGSSRARGWTRPPWGTSRRRW